MRSTPPPPLAPQGSPAPGRRPWKALALVLGVGLALALGTPAPAREEAPKGPAPTRVTSGWSYYRDGNPRDASPAGLGGVALVGGGGNVEPAFRWMIQRSGGGDFLVLRAAGDAQIHPYLLGLGGLDSVETLLLRTRQASWDPFVLERVRRAEAIFLAGGDQSRYLERWKDTPLQEALNQAAARGVPVGGTSAGLAVLGQFCFSARKGSVTPGEAMADPGDPRITLDRDFLRLPHLEGVLTDSHFDTRERLGRLVTFLAVLSQRGWAERPRGLGVDERTAVLMEPDGPARVVGEAAAFFVQAPGRPERCQAGSPLGYQDVSVQEVPSGGSFNLATWTGTGTRFRVSVRDGRLHREE